MKLAVVMPVYNEEAVIERVIDEWLAELNRLNLNFCMFAINDGSKDNTLLALEKLEAKSGGRLAVLNKPNSGHGQTCVYGYRHALAAGYDWVLQIDSDGQCAPEYFASFLEAAQKHKCVFGFRKKREDGFIRYLISRFVSLFAYAATGIWVKDANVPYRLMQRSALEPAAGKIPQEFYLANILLSLFLQKRAGIRWVNIVFRNRFGGVPSIKAFSFVKHGTKLFRELRKISF